MASPAHRLSSARGVSSVQQSSSAADSSSAQHSSVAENVPSVLHASSTHSSSDHNSDSPAPSQLVPTPKDRVWRVIHACDSIRSVADLVEAQIAAGMRPFVLTGDARPRAASLLETWNDVRAWRTHLQGTDAATHPLQSSVVHAHSFAPAMAAVRAGLTTVYDVRACVEDFAVTAGQCAERSWLARSFRTAEEFLLPRAGALVVHSALMRTACLERGVAEADLFVVPAPLPLPARSATGSYSDAGWLRRAFDFYVDIVTIFARPAVAEDETLIRAFAQTAAEVPGARLFLAAADEQAAQLRRFAHEQEVDELVFFLSPEDEQPALEAADIVLAGWPVFPDNSSWGRIHALNVANSGTALSAMAHGRCLLAADCSAHRDLTPEGRGCLWYGNSGYGNSGYGNSGYGNFGYGRAEFGSDSVAASDSASSVNASGSVFHTKDKASELANRLAFLARNPDFRRALAENARQHLAQTRDPERIGKMYREVYGHAELRRQRGDDATGPTPILIPSQAST